MNKVVIYTSSFCGYCTAAKTFLTQKGIIFKEINISTKPELRQELYRKWNWNTVPLVVINNKLVGGYRELVNLDSFNKLDKFLN